jgi:hypothetical protein
VQLTPNDLLELLYEQPFTLRVKSIRDISKLDLDEILGDYFEKLTALENAKNLANHRIIGSIRNKLVDDYYSALFLKEMDDYQIHDALKLP